MNDDDLLDLLGATMAEPPAEPSDAEVAHVRDLVADRVVVPFRSPWPRRAAATGVVLAVLVTTGTAAAVVRTGSLPDSVRRVASAVGLPVDSVGVAQTRAAMADLEEALAGRDDGDVRRASAVLRADLADLSPAETDQVQPEAGGLLAQADAFLAIEEAADDLIRPGGDAVEDDDATGGGDGGEGTPSGGGSGDGGSDDGDVSAPGPSGSGDGGSSGSGSSGSGSGSGSSGSGDSGGSGDEDDEDDDSSGSGSGGSSDSGDEDDDSSGSGSGGSDDGASSEGSEADED